MYVIKNPRIGVVGEPFDADAARKRGVNVDALIAGGFIVESPNAPAKASKVKPKTPEKD